MGSRHSALAGSKSAIIKKPAASQTPTDLPPYSYQPLTGERYIRVLEVHGADSYDTPLNFKILEISLDTPPEYYAISYCWEGQTPSRRVICEGQALLITANCEAALKRFRRRQDETILLWIDAICINQSAAAVLERNHQVLMMGEVYSAAAQVQVWLGTERLKKLRKRAVSTLKWYRDLGDAAREFDREKRKTKVLEIALMAEPQGRFIPWFRRIWVIQEVLLSKSATMCMDDVVIDYRGIILASEIIRKASTNAKLAGCYRFLLNDFRIFRDLENHGTGSKKSSGSGVGSILKASRTYLSSDPRDKIFALHSLLQTAGLPLPRPDYSKDVATVYRETTKALLLQSRSLNILKQVRELGANLGLSSWSPNWHERTYPARPYPERGQGFCASGLSSPELSFSSKDLLLSCKGRIFETVSVYARVSLAHNIESLGKPEDYLSWSRNLQPSESFWIDLLSTRPELSKSILRVWNIHVLKKLISFVSSTVNQHQEGEHAQRDLQSCFLSYIQGNFKFQGTSHTGAWDGWRSNIMKEQSNATIVPDSQRGPKAAQPETEEQTIWIANKELSRLRWVRKELKHSKASSVLQTQEFSAWERICSDHNQATLNYTIMRTAHYQTLFRTDSSNTLGMAPHSIREGDHIALLAGLDVPMIIRPLENGHYRMIAPAYVCGIMEGQAWDSDWELADGSLLQDLTFE
ncbi:hypothetical protein BDZ45DRAFT_692774 [Acephala macrosclerotiorum]|nr:hypothetical protein BDZ45DRAFT_692774 [Acephala macrosclerotiorum]